MSLDVGVWVDAAQVISGFAALAAVWLSVETARAARRVPLTDAYMGAWQSIIDVLAVATEGRPEPPPEDEADRLLRQFTAADHQLAVIEATVRVRVYGRAIRLDLKNLLIDTLYDNPEVRSLGDRPLSVTILPREDWANCTDDEWERVMNTPPFAAMLGSQVWSLPGRPDDQDGLLRWYFPTVLHNLDAKDSVVSPRAAPQRQLAFMLGAYVDTFLLPWVRDASREALMGRLGARGQKALWRQRRHRWKYEPPWRRRRPYSGLSLFESTDRRR